MMISGLIEEIQVLSRRLSVGGGVWVSLQSDGLDMFRVRVG